MYDAFFHSWGCAGSKHIYLRRRARSIAPQGSVMSGPSVERMNHRANVISMAVDDSSGWFCAMLPYVFNY